MTLKKNKDFAFVYKKGKPRATKSLVCLCTKSRFKGVRVGFVVSAKIGGSVVRNKIRRRLKEAYREIFPYLSGNVSVVFVARNSITEQSYKSLAHDMRYLLKKQEIYKKAET